MLIVARLGRVRGLKGEIKLHSFCSPTSNILNHSEFYCSSSSQISHNDKKLVVDTIKPEGDVFLVKFVGFCDKDEAQLLVNSYLGIPKTQLPPLKESEYYWQDLINLPVYSSGELLGTVESILEAGAHDVMMVEGDKSYAIPFSSDYVIDVKEDKILVNWPL